MNSRCREIQEALSAYADGQERAGETPLVRAHLESCAECRERLAQWQQLSVPTSEPLGSLPEQVAARIQGVRPRRVWAGKALVAAALLTMAATGTVLSGLTSPAGDELAAEQGSPPAAAVSHKPTARPTNASTGRPTTPPTARPTSSRGTDGRLQLVLRLDKGWATEGDEVTADFTLRNVTDESITFLAPAESAFDLVIRHGRNVVYRRSSGWSGEMVSRTIAPGEQITETFVFATPEAGGYVIHGSCPCGHQRGQSIEPTPAPVDRPSGRPGTNRPTDRPTTRPTERPRSGPIATGEIRFISYPAE